MVLTFYSIAWMILGAGFLCAALYVNKTKRAANVKKSTKFAVNVAFVVSFVMLFFSVLNHSYRLNAYLIIIGVFLFSATIFVHELGHFMFAKWSGVTVHKFALGMGPALFKFQKGETEYSLRLFPIGGYCAMEGEDEESNEEGSFGKKPVWKRMCIVVAGACMNFLLGVVLMCVVLAQSSALYTTTVGRFAKGAKSDQQLQVGDKILSINGYDVNTVKDINNALGFAGLVADKGADTISVPIKVKRGNEKITLDGVQFTLEKTSGNNLTNIDFETTTMKKTFLTVLGRSFLDSFAGIKQVWASLGLLITGKVGINMMSGPVGMTSAMSQVASQSMQQGGFGFAVLNLIRIVALITINLGVMNLLPLPALDGGRLLFLLIEGIRRKPINPKYEGYIHAAGLVLFIGLFIFFAFNDTFRIFTGKGIGG